MQALTGTKSVPVSFDLAPVPASRPRVSRWGVYYAKNYKDWMKDAHPFVTQCVEQYEGPLAVLVEVVCPPPKTVKRDYPRGDVDNYAKGPLDVITKSETVWQDDEQIVALLVVKRYMRADEVAHTRVEVFKL